MYEIGSLPAGMGMPADIEASIAMLRQHRPHLVGVLNREKWHQRMIIAFLFGVAIQHGVIQWAMGKDDGPMGGVL